MKKDMRNRSKRVADVLPPKTLDQKQLGLVAGGDGELFHWGGGVNHG